MTTEAAENRTENNVQIAQNMSNKDLAAMVTTLGKKYGYEQSVASFVPIRDFKVRWTRTFKWISIEICDYLADAPEEVIKSLLTTIFKRISGEDEAEYGPDVVSWLTSESFIREKQPVYISRTKGLSSPRGACKDLRESYDRLAAKGLAEPDPAIYIGWGKFPDSYAVGRSSIVTKVISMSDMLDSADIDDALLDYCLYSQLMRLKMGFNAGPWNRMSEYNALLDQFPDRNAMERELERMELHI